MREFENNRILYDEYEVVRIITGGKWKENCYNIINHKECTQHIIDPGYDAQDVIKQVEQNIHYKVDHIIITHAHHDHIGGAYDLSKYFNLPCVIHPNDKKVLRHAYLYSFSFAKRKINIPDNILWLDYTIYQQLKEKKLEVLNTPGHTQGSLSIHYMDSLFTGDTIFKNAMGRTDLPESDKEKLYESITTILSKFSNIDIFPGHGAKWDTETAKLWWNSCVDKAEYKNFE